MFGDKRICGVGICRKIRDVEINLLVEDILANRITETVKYPDKLAVGRTIESAMHTTNEPVNTFSKGMHKFSYSTNFLHQRIFTTTSDSRTSPSVNRHAHSPSFNSSQSKSIRRNRYSVRPEPCIRSINSRSGSIPHLNPFGRKPISLDHHSLHIRTRTDDSTGRYDAMPWYPLWVRKWGR